MIFRTIFQKLVNAESHLPLLLFLVSYVGVGIPRTTCVTHFRVVVKASCRYWHTICFRKVRVARLRSAPLPRRVEGLAIVWVQVSSYFPGIGGVLYAATVDVLQEQAARAERDVCG